MKTIFIAIILSFFLFNKTFAYEEVYKTNFYKININNENISQAKIKEIDLIKKKSFYNILKKILTNKSFKKFKRSLDINNDVNYLIKNIIINDEFISLDKYSANIKINFEKKEIIKLLRNNKISYSDIKSSNILLVSSEKNLLLEEGMSNKNTFYQKIELNNDGLIKLFFPNLTTNDRFILPFEKILNKDILSLEKISQKYKTYHIIIINLQKEEQHNILKISFYSSLKNNVTNIGEIKINSNLDYQNQLLDFLNNWWKNDHLIDNKLINKNSCFIKNSNIHELHYINSIINSSSQVKSNTLNQINLNLNLNDIVYYGKLSFLSLKLLNQNIYLKINQNNECIISII